MSSSGNPQGILIHSEDETLFGALYLGKGKGPHPTAIVLHGIPGIEKNTDIVYALRDKGWNALIFHYRGSWGSGGKYTLAGIPSDVSAAINHLMNGAFDVDADRLALVGHSLGGWAAIISAARHARVKAAVTIAGISDMRSWSLSQEEATEMARFLSNTSGGEILSQIRALGQTRNPVDVLDNIGMLPILIVHGDADEVVSIDQARLLHERSNRTAELVVIKGADHSFSGHRKQMVDAVVNWLNDKV
jgi:dipeptidyl aminopeptidase/acylaminoacyl peptidase